MKCRDFCNNSLELIEHLFGVCMVIKCRSHPGSFLIKNPQSITNKLFISIALSIYDNKELIGGLQDNDVILLPVEFVMLKKKPMYKKKQEMSAYFTVILLLSLNLNGCQYLFDNHGCQLWQPKWLQEPQPPIMAAGSMCN